MLSLPPPLASALAPARPAWYPSAAERTVYTLGRKTKDERRHARQGDRPSSVVRRPSSVVRRPSSVVRRLSGGARHPADLVVLDARPVRVGRDERAAVLPIKRRHGEAVARRQVGWQRRPLAVHQPADPQVA